MHLLRPGPHRLQRHTETETNTDRDKETETWTTREKEGETESERNRQKLYERRQFEKKMADQDDASAPRETKARTKTRGVRFYRFSGFYRFALFTVRKTGSF